MTKERRTLGGAQEDSNTSNEYSFPTVKTLTRPADGESRAWR